MADIVFGLLAIVAGGFLLSAGQFVLRLVLTTWGIFAGFALGAGLFAGLADERFLGSVLGWVAGFVLALVFAAFAYFSFAVSVILAMAAFGFTIGSGLVLALGIDWSWVAVVVGLVVGAMLGLVSVTRDLPMIVLSVVSAIAGAVCVVAGLMLLVGSLNAADLTQSAGTDALHVSPGWDLTVVGLALVGILAQARSRATMRRDIREAWGAQRL